MGSTNYLKEKNVVLKDTITLKFLTGIPYSVKMICYL